MPFGEAASQSILAYRLNDLSNLNHSDMSDDTTQSNIDLFEGSNTTDASADAGTTDEKSNDLLESKEIQTESKPAENTAQVQRQKQIDHWVNEIAAGTKSLNDLPADKQWLKPGIEQGLNFLNKAPDIEKAIEEKLAKKESERAFKAQKQLLAAMSLTRDQRSTLNAEFNENKALGLPDEVALTKAMRVAGISTDQEEQDRLIMRKRMALPTGNDTRLETDADPMDPEFHKKVTDPAKKMKLLMQAYQGK